MLLAISSFINDRDHSQVARQWINLPMRIQKHVEVAHGKPYPEWFLQAIPHKKDLKIFDKDDEKNRFLKEIYIASLCFAQENGEPCMTFLNEYQKDRSSKKNSVRSYEIDFVISRYPKEVLQKIQSVNGNALEKGGTEVLTKTMIYFHAARTASSELRSN